MIRHLIASKLKDNSAENKAKVKEMLLSMDGRIKEIKSIEVGTDFVCSQRSYDVVLIISVESKEALQAYIDDPYHVGTIMPFMASVRESSVAVDWEI